jgi:D-alanyl-D-alanine carboxypeptidase/D-alanyl-D-alanine-endopeptidase (penicillin-binding protein 4)
MTMGVVVARPRPRARLRCPAVRRALTPVLLIVVSMVASWQAIAADRDGDLRSNPASAAASPATGAPSATPLLSVRRVPRWLATPSADAKLVAQLSALAAAAPADSCLVVREGTRTLAEHHDDAALVPASNLKILTGFAALASFGPDGQLRTSAVAATAPVGGVVSGDLTIIGGGDPLLATADYIAQYDEPAAHRDIAVLADAIVAAGVREIRGAIVGDDTAFDSQRTVPSWKPSYITDHEAGPLSALLVNDGYTKYATRAAPGGAVAVATDPAAHSAAMLRAALAVRGVTSTTSRSGAAPVARVEVAALGSAPMSAIVAEMLTLSDNTTAEMLTKALGHKATGQPGTTASGTAAIRAILEKAALPTSGVTLTDGSGLDTSNRMTCSLLADVLDVSGADSPLAKGLAVAGTSGTLRKRMLGTVAVGKVHAKTGSLNGARSLAGLVPTADGRTLTFAFISNRANIFQDASYTAMQDQLAVMLAGYPQGPGVAQLAPPG